MTEIISASLDESTLKELKKLQTEYGFNGRSETIRSAVFSLLNESKTLTQLTGNIDAAIIVTHPEKQTAALFKIMHEFQLLIKSQVHYHLNEHKCLEMFILRGEARKIEQVLKLLKKAKVNVAKLIVL